MEEKVFQWNNKLFKQTKGISRVNNAEYTKAYSRDYTIQYTNVEKIRR